MKTIGKLLPNNKVELHWSGQGYIYKNFEAFKNKTNEICYIPEYGIDEENNIEQSYTYNDFLEFATEYLKNNKGYKLTPEQFAEELFNIVDWQSVEVLIDEYADVWEE